jgi:type VI secretion system secreted protein VgrG
MTVEAIVSEVVSSHLRKLDRTFEFRLTRALPTREYTVQYNESDLEFVSRLLIAEGLSYWFEPGENGKEHWVVGDTFQNAEAIDTFSGGEVRVVDAYNNVSDDEVMLEFGWVKRSISNKVKSVDFDWTRVGVRLEATQEMGDESDDGEIYKADRHFALSEYDRGSERYTKEDIVAQNRIRAEIESGGKEFGCGTSQVLGMMPGRYFSLVGHPSPELDQDYAVQGVTHRGVGVGTAEDGGRVAGGASGADYSNEVEVRLKSKAYRPQQMQKKPKIGPMTATVVGPPGEEIFTDEHGRIKVQFHWDRLGKRNDRSSCWLRVMQTWAGAGWGFGFTPRIGMECVIHFLYDDIDQPLVVGTVYNGDNRWAYPLPDKATKSYLRTRSTPGADGSQYNELRFEDQMGGEEVYLQAQKDLNELVKHDHSTTVKRHQSNAVTGEHTVSVGGNRSVSVKKNETYTVTQNRTTAVKGNDTRTVCGSRLSEVQGTQTELVAQMATEMYGLGRTTMISGAPDTTMVALAKILNVSGGLMVNTSALALVQAPVPPPPPPPPTLTGACMAPDSDMGGAAGGSSSGGGSGGGGGAGGGGGSGGGSGSGGSGGGDATSVVLDNKIVATTPGEAHFKSKDASLELNIDKAELDAKSEISLTCGQSSIVLKSDGTITIKGALKVELGAGATVVKLEPTGLSNSGPKISSAAIGIQEITGALVKIN